MFVNENYEDYKYIVDVSDNFVVLTDTKRLTGESGDEQDINVIYQYLSPSFLTIEDTISVDYSKTLKEIDQTNDFFSRGDSISVLVGVYFVVILFLLILSNLTKVFVRGGLR